MPELPEVETVRIGLHRMIIGKKIASIIHDWPKSFPNSKSDADTFMVGATIIDVRRRAKVLLIDLSTQYSLVIHLKMTGQMVYRGSEVFGAGHPNDSLVGDLPDSSTRVIIEFSDTAKLFFNDQRKFGWMRLIPTSEVEFIDFMKRVGPEPLSEEFTTQIFLGQLMKRKNSTIKSVLLDQSIIAGIGNIYADESLWGAQIHPLTKTADISRQKLLRLRTEIQSVLRIAIEKGGSTDRNYVNAEGKKGSYMSFARVFRRDKEPCMHCGTIIIKIRAAGRGTHLCPKCQKRISK